MQKNYLGGQALIEGVMIKNKDKISIAVRNNKGKIIVKKRLLKFKESNIPFLRGIINLITIIYIGINSLNFSSNIASGKNEKLTWKEFGFSIILALLFGIFIFKFIPLITTTFIDSKFKVNNILFNVIEGVLKIIIFILYVYIISFSNDVKRIFQYHGAEHKAIACYEDNNKLNIINVQNYSTLHKRCGTTFIFLVLFLSIIIYTFIPKEASVIMKLFLRVLLLPVIAGLSYEVLRLGAKYSFMKIFTFPGLWIQNITTQEPDDKQVEVAIKAVNNALE